MVGSVQTGDDSRDKTLPESQFANKDEVAGSGLALKKYLWLTKCSNLSLMS